MSNNGLPIESPPSWQQTIAQAVRLRGYTQGELTQEQFAVKQLAKLVEEVYEYASCFSLHNPEYTYNKLYRMLDALQEASQEAENLFSDALKVIALGTIKISSHAPAELADVLITLAMNAEVLGVDVEEIAVAKATKDVTRGVRI